MVISFTVFKIIYSASRTSDEVKGIPIEIEPVIPIRTSSIIYIPYDLLFSFLR